jgi:hypothetical protein
MIEQTAVRRAGNRIDEPRNVDPILRRAAELTAELVCRELGIMRPAIRWLAADRRDIRGQTLPVNLGEVWVRAGQTVADTIETTSHEARHCWQLQPNEYRWAQRGLDTMEGREEDAAEYGRRIAAELT